MSGSFDRSQAEEFCDLVYGNDTGYLTIALGYDGYINEAGKYTFPPGKWQESFYEYPIERKLALDNIEHEIATGDKVDVYVCPYLRTEPKRRAGNAVAHKVLHADRDSAIPLDLGPGGPVQILGAFVVSSGTPGHEHVYARLSDDAGAAHEALQRGLAAYLGECDHKYADNDVLRLPGTINWKGENESPVKILARSGFTYSADAIGEVLRVDPPSVPQSTDSAALPESLPPKIQTAFDSVTSPPDRSEDIASIVRACVEEHWNTGMTTALIRRRNDLRARLDEMGTERAASDIRRLINKTRKSLREQRQRGHEHTGTIVSIGGNVPTPGVSNDSPDDADGDEVAAQQEAWRIRIRERAREIVDSERQQRQWREPISRALEVELAQADEKIVYTIEDVLPHGTNAVLTAQYKTGKTTLLNNVALSLVDGHPLLGQYPVHPFVGNVGIWNYEVSDTMFRRWVRSLGFQNQKRVILMHLRGRNLSLQGPPGRPYAVDWLQEHNIHTWIVDPFARAATGIDENSNSDVGQWLDNIDTIKDEAGVSNLILATHTGRSDQAANRARGATRLDDWADSRWLLVADENTGARYFRATGRDVDTEWGKLAYAPLTRRLTISAWEDPPDLSRRPRKQPPDTLANAILKSVETLSGQSKNEVFLNVKHLQSNKPTVLKEFTRLEQQNRITVIKDGNADRVYLPAQAAALDATRFGPEPV